MNTNFLNTQNKKMLAFAILLIGQLITAGKPAQAFDLTQNTTQKLGGNIFSLLALGDINASYERSVSTNFSFTSTLHYLTTSELLSTVGTGFRVSAGARAYKSSNLKGVFLEFKGGYGYYKTLEGEQVTGKYGSPSAEFYAGYSKRFNDNFYYDYKIGAMRLLNNGKILPGAGLSLGFKFN